MLGLGASVNNEESYAKGERFRERFHTGGTYHAGNNPLGRNGVESDYIGDFADSDDADLYSTSGALVAVDSGTLRVSCGLGETGGFAHINVNALAGVQYKLTVLYDPNSDANTNGSIVVATLGGTQLATTGALSVGDANTTQTLTFTHTATVNSLTIRFSADRGLKKTFYDNISFKEA
tara:strand:+ start:619 stop:1152 length:534 start_codon:yes stop_codon:yes gene_type:complete